MMAWQNLIPIVTLKVWPGPYEGTAPLKNREASLQEAESIPQTEFSVQCFKGKKPIGPRHRFGKATTLAELWEKLIDFR